VAAEVVDNDPGARPVGGHVEATVAKDLDTSVFRQRAKQLGEQTRQAKQEAEKRLQKKFDHKLGKLDSQKQPRAKPVEKPQAAVAVIPATSAAGFAAMLRNADNVRQAIILNEILARPVDRW